MDNQTDTTNPPVNELDTPPTLPTTEVLPELPREPEHELPASTGNESEVVSADTEHSSGTMSRLELESMITRYLDEQEKLKNQYRTQKEMYDAAFENDAEYMEKSEAAGELKKTVAAIKQKIVKDPSVVEASNRMKQIKEDIRDIQDAISRYAEQYVEVAGTNQLMREDGEALQIVKNYKVVKQKKES